MEILKMSKFYQWYLNIFFIWLVELVFYCLSKRMKAELYLFTLSDHLLGIIPSQRNLIKDKLFWSKFDQSYQNNLPDHILNSLSNKEVPQWNDFVLSNNEEYYC